MDGENLPPLQDTPPPSCSGGAESSPPASSSGGCLTVVRGSQWAGFAHRLRGSPTPSSSSRSSATTADTFLLEDVSDVLFPLILLTGRDEGYFQSSEETVRVPGHSYAGLILIFFQLESDELAGPEERPADSSVEDEELAGLLDATPIAHTGAGTPGGSRPPTRRSRRVGNSLSPLHSLPYSGRRF